MQLGETAERRAGCVVEIPVIDAARLSGRRADVPCLDSHLGFADGLRVCDRPFRALDAGISACRATRRLRVNPGVSTWLGFGMVCVGVFVSVLAAVHHRGYIHALELGVANPPLPVKTSMIVAGILALVGAGYRHQHSHALNREATMQLGMIGLGRMGSNMVRRLLRNGQECVVYDVHAAAAAPLVEAGAVAGGRASRNSSPSSRPPAPSG